MPDAGGGAGPRRRGRTATGPRPGSQGPGPAVPNTRIAFSRQARNSAVPVRLVVARRVVGVRAQRHGVAEQHPRFQPGQGDSGQAHRAHAGRALAVQAQAVGVVAGRERQLGLAEHAHGPAAERRRGLADVVDPAELVLRVGEPPVGDRAQHEQRAELELVVAGAEPPHHRQGGGGVLDRRGPVADVHGELGQGGPRHRRRPGAVIVAGQRQGALGGGDRARHVPGVLPHMADPLAGGERGRPVFAVGEPLKPAHERVGVGFRRVVREQHPRQPGQLRAARVVLPQPQQDRRGVRCRSRPSSSASC